MPEQTARQRATTLLESREMLAHQTKKMESLSRGMGQIIQVMSHHPRPAVIILDERTPASTRSTPSF